jgi:glucose-1-phosphate cytidylyltransferase
VRVVILCGGRGLRLMPHTADRPKPMVEVGGYPLLWHVMRHYAAYGHRDFVLACGYKADVVCDWACGYRAPPGISTGPHKDWGVQYVNTGEDTATGGRLLRVRDLLGREPFLLAYGDGLADADLTDQWAWHQNSGKVCTMTVVHPRLPFGVVAVEDDWEVLGFREKPISPAWASAGFFVCEPAIWDYVVEGPLETTALPRMAKDRVLTAWPHGGYFRGVDTHQDLAEVREAWDGGNAPWAAK